MDICSFCSAPAVIVVVVVVSLYLLFGRRNAAKSLDPTVPKGTVLLHMFPRGPKAPNLSPFPIKLEMFLRVTKIPYICDFKDFMSSKGKSPWMQLNGETTADSQFCIDRLKREIGVDLDEHLSRREKAISRAFLALIEDCFYWTLLTSRWVRASDNLLKYFPIHHRLIIRMTSIPNLRKQSWMQGMGRHSREEQWEIFKSCMDSLSDYMGDKPYLMGEKISEIDCSLFGFMVQIIYHDFEDEVHKNYVKRHCPNLVNFVKRIRKEFWVDSQDFSE